MKNSLLISTNTQSTILAIVRMVFGFFLIFHGWEIFSAEKMNGYQEWNKFSGQYGMVMVYLGKGAELAAGILIMIGWHTRFASIIALLTMGYIAFFVGNGKIWYEDQHPFMFVLLALMYFALGGGKWSVDEIRN